VNRSGEEKDMNAWKRILAVVETIRLMNICGKWRHPTPSLKPDARKSVWLKKILSGKIRTYFTPLTHISWSIKHKMIKSHKIRLNPVSHQEVYFYRASGVARFAWNWALDEYERYKDAGRGE